MTMASCSAFRNTKAYTYSTFDGIAMYTVHHSCLTWQPAYTTNIRVLIKNAEDIKLYFHILQIVNRRDTHNPFQYWRLPLQPHPQDNGKIYYRYWPLYLRLFKTGEENMAKNCKAWATDLTSVVNDLAPYNLDGTAVIWPVCVEYT